MEGHYVIISKFLLTKFKFQNWLSFLGKASDPAGIDSAAFNSEEKPRTGTKECPKIHVRKVNP